MGRPRSKDGYIYYLSPRANKDGRYVYERYEFNTSGKRNKVRVVFYSHKNRASIVAADIHKKFLMELKSKEKKRTAVIADVPRLVNEGAEIFIARREEGRKGIAEEHSITQVSSRLRRYFIPFFEGMPFRKVSADAVFKYKQHVESTGLADRTKTYLLQEAKEFFAYAEELGWVKHTPFDSTVIIPKSTQRKHRMPIDIELLRKLATSPWDNPINRAVFILGLCTGCRISELRAMKKDAFEFIPADGDHEKCMLLHIVHSYTNKNREKTPKNGRVRKTVIPMYVYDFIKPIFDLSETQLAFSNTRGKAPISIDKNLKNLRKEISKITGLSFQDVLDMDIDFHSVRTTVNSRLTGTLNDDLRRSILGWSSENVGLDHYLQIIPIHYQKILDALDEVIFSEKEQEYFKQNTILNISIKGE